MGRKQHAINFPCLLRPPTYPSRVSNPWESLHPWTRRPSPARPAIPSPAESPAGCPGLTADHPAAESSVAAEQRGAQRLIPRGSSRRERQVWRGAKVASARLAARL